MTKFIALTILIIASVPLNSQEFDPYSLFPHHEGDVWEYNFLNADYEQRQQSIVLSDATVNGVAHIRTKYRQLYDNWNEYYIDYMIDTAFNVWMYDTTYYCCDTVLYYRLNAIPGDTWIVKQWGDSYFQIAVFDTLYEDVFWGEEVTFSVYSYYETLDTTNTDEWYWLRSRVLASNFGLVRTYSEGTGGIVLLGAVIDGILWGDTTYVSINKDQQSLPSGIYLNNYPNPFNPSTIIEYGLPEPSDINLTVFDLLGREVITLINGSEKAGYKKVIWNGTDKNGRPVSAGMYLLRIKAASNNSDKTFTQKQKIILLK